jgi:hypothetical protein
MSLDQFSHPNSGLTKLVQVWHAKPDTDVGGLLPPDDGFGPWLAPPPGPVLALGGGAAVEVCGIAIDRNKQGITIQIAT